MEWLSIGAEGKEKNSTHVEHLKDKTFIFVHGAAYKQKQKQANKLY